MKPSSLLVWIAQMAVVGHQKQELGIEAAMVTYNKEQLAGN